MIERVRRIIIFIRCPLKLSFSLPFSVDWETAIREGINDS